MVCVSLRGKTRLFTPSAERLLNTSKKIIPSLRLLIVTIVFGHDCAAVQLPYFASGTLKSGKHCGSVALCLFSACCVSLRV